MSTEYTLSSFKAVYQDRKTLRVKMWKIQLIVSLKKVGAKDVA